MKTWIIPAAGKPQNPLFPGIYDPMIPINGKPTIDYILEQSKKWGAEKNIIILNANDQESKEYLEFRGNSNLLVIQIDGEGGIGKTLSAIKGLIEPQDNIIINLGDTLYIDSIENVKGNAILVSQKPITDPSQWCFIDEKGRFINKPEKNHENYRVVAGIYSITHTGDFFSYLSQEKYDFYKSLSHYHQDHPFQFIDIKEGRYDLGHTEEYYKSKIDFLRVRSFNGFEYDSFRGIITKKSKNKEKLRQEVNRFLNLPNDLKNFTPRLVDYCNNDQTYYSLEFYGYASLADNFIFGQYPFEYRKGVVDKLMHLTNYMKEEYHIHHFPYKNIYEIYYKKTCERLERLKSNDILANILNGEKVTINDVEYLNPIRGMIEGLEGFVTQHVHRQEDYCIVHGDMCFSNILYDTYNGLIKLIDPRGSFGEVGIYGDIKYDLAKIRHSIHGKYEYIIADLFELSYDISTMTFSYQYFKGNVYDELIQYFDQRIEHGGYDKETIIAIEGLLFLSMIPLHDDKLERQIMMLLTAIQIFN